MYHDTIFLCNLIISEYDFKKRLNTYCDPKGDMFQNVEEAKRECKSTHGCQGVLDTTPSGQQGFYLCPTTSKTSSEDGSQDTLFQKFIIGKKFI